jgi:hypothetical protein
MNEVVQNGGDNESQRVKTNAVPVRRRNRIHFESGVPDGTFLHGSVEFNAAQEACNQN